MTTPTDESGSATDRAFHAGACTSALGTAADALSRARVSSQEIGGFEDPMTQAIRIAQKAVNDAAALLREVQA